MATVSKKICLVGDFGVGKTSLIRRFVENQFSDEYLSTVGVKISRKSVSLQEAGSVQLLVWDLEGRTNLKPIVAQHMKGASGAIIVGDLTRSETIERIAEHIHQFLDVNPQGYTIVAFNKADLVDEEKRPESIEFAEADRVIATYKTSAKTGEHVDEMFELLAHQMMTEKAR